MAMNIFGNNFICVFCDERQKRENASITSYRVGICKRCAASLSKTSLSLPYKGTKSISYIMSPFEYSGALREVILDFKFKGCRAYAPLLGKMMREYISSYDIWEDFDCIVPVPLHEKRLKERGYNQSELVANAICNIAGLPVRCDVIKRTRATKRQSGLKRYDRVTNVQGAFEGSTAAKGMNIILFDDICTTGNTLEACAAALKKAGAKNICALTLSIHTEQNLPSIMY